MNQVYRLWRVYFGSDLGTGTGFSRAGMSFQFDTALAAEVSYSRFDGVFRSLFGANVMNTIEISCREVWREISNFLEGSVDPALRARMEAHFAVCDNCKAVLDGTENVVKLIGDGETFDVPVGFSERLFSKLCCSGRS